MNDPGGPSARKEWAAHWPLVIACALGASLASIAIGSLGTFVGPIEQGQGWNRAEVVAGLSIYAVVGVVCSPLTGYMVDRWGVRRVGVPGVLLCGAAFAMLGTVSGSLLHWYALWVLFSVAAQTARPLLWTSAISGSFERGRSFALAVALAGIGIGGIVAPALAYFLIDGVGWRKAYIVMGLGWGTVSWLACYLFLYRAKAAKKPPAAKPVTNAAAVPAEGGMTLRQALRSPYFLKLAGATFCANTLMVGLMVHLVPLLTETGLSRGDAIWLVGLGGAVSLIGKFICGILADHYRGDFIAAFFMALPMATCALLLSAGHSLGARMCPVIALSVAGGAQTHMFAYLATRYFGLRAFGTIYGFIASIMAIAVGIGPLLAGYIHDVQKSYDVVLIAGFPMSIVATVLLLTLGRYPDLTGTPENPATGRTG